MQKKLCAIPLKRLRKHECIVRAASRLFRERGFEKVSGGLMKAAGLTHGAFYAISVQRKS
jgi:AcrR family transcriptional regulator